MASDQVRPPQVTGDAMTLMIGLLRETLAAVEDVRARINATRKQLYTVDEVARLTGRTPYTVRRWVAEAKLHAIRVEGTGPRGRLLIPGDQLARLLPQGLGGNLPATAADDAAPAGGQPA